MFIKKHIPNTITCCNLLCGCIAIVQAFEGNLVNAAYLVGLAAIFDFFDGFAARILKVSSAIGKDLDSLADMVTFGVVPGVVMFQLIKKKILDDNLELIIKSNDNIFQPYNNEFNLSLDYLLPFTAFLITMFSAIRLAKFNNDTRQTESFVGLPTPANAILICSIPLILKYSNHFNFSFISIIYFLIFTTIVLSLLLISEIPLFALKFKHFKWKDNEIRFTFLGLCLVLLATLQFVGIPLIIMLYVVLSIINNKFIKPKTII